MSKTPIQAAPASEASPDDIRTCWLRHGDRVGISGVAMILVVYAEGAAKLHDDRADGLGRVRAMCGTDDPSWMLTRSDGGWAMQGKRFTKDELRGATAIRLSPDGATWKVEIDAPPMTFMELPTYPSGGAR